MGKEERRECVKRRERERGRKNGEVKYLKERENRRPGKRGR